MLPRKAAQRPAARRVPATRRASSGRRAPSSRRGAPATADRLGAAARGLERRHPLERAHVAPRVPRDHLPDPPVVVKLFVDLRPQPLGTAARASVARVLLSDNVLPEILLGEALLRVRDQHHRLVQQRVHDQLVRRPAPRVPAMSHQQDHQQGRTEQVRPVCHRLLLQEGPPLLAAHALPDRARLSNRRVGLVAILAAVQFAIDTGAVFWALGALGNRLAAEGHMLAVKEAEQVELREVRQQKPCQTQADQHHEHPGGEQQVLDERVAECEVALL
mmetsp:Transcript_64761/g.179951  ORF Transcript_64761/g.179951 Transcript_64761/m.179951 type:complete len:275 (-) Transcript_64761:175-999(-)